WLTPGERARLEGFRFEKRRRDWLLGRWTAKIALLGITGVPDRDIGRLEIASAPDGAPLPRLDNRPCPVALSLSHSNNRALAAVMQGATPLGCDLELVESRSPGFVETYFTTAECEAVERANPEDRDTLVTIIWSAKESTLKALRHGLRVDTRSVEVSADGEIAAADWSTARIFASDEGTFSCWWRVDGPSILSVVARPPIEMPVALERGETVSMPQSLAVANQGALRQ
ncbi:MAG: 4'-phosphopantetheinyl transferase superfamily protein, partial [Gammaproteobacteria bacterium]|nr:4'-phosphopantetheinyl transferase superfamily protein [Gammaproteobacteria bacterium]